jgi:hypothetical protein
MGHAAMKSMHIIAIFIIHVVGTFAGLNATRGKDASDWLVSVACGSIITVLLLGYGLSLHYLDALKSKINKE